MRPWVGLTALALLAGCGGGESESGLTADEEAKLNEAAAMLDEAPDELGSAEAENAASER